MIDKQIEALQQGAQASATGHHGRCACACVPSIVVMLLRTLTSEPENQTQTGGREEQRVDGTPTTTTSQANQKNAHEQIYKSMAHESRSGIARVLRGGLQ